MRVTFCTVSWRIARRGTGRLQTTSLVLADCGESKRPCRVNEIHGYIAEVAYGFNS